MSEAASLTTTILALGTIASLVVAIALFALMRLRKDGILLTFVPFALPAALVLTLAASVLTLVYSEVWGIAPCGWCWFQRVFMYPMPLLLLVALATKDSGVWKYVMALSIPGALIALYQHFLQIGVVGALPCPATPGIADCAQRIVFEFGFVTFPLMAFGTFVLVAVLMLLLRRGS